jgi:hypothetical protein
LRCEKKLGSVTLDPYGSKLLFQDLAVSGDNGGVVGTWDAMSVIRHKRWIAVALIMSALAVSGCTSSIADLPLVGTPSDAPERPKEPGAYLPVNDLPPERDEQVLDPKERARIQAELTAARDRQAVVLPPQNGQTQGGQINASQNANQSQGPTQSQGSK